MTQIEANVFARRIHKAHQWLDDLRRELAPSTDEEAYRALRATLHVLRDALTLQEMADLSAQLPLVLRGVFLEGWSPRTRRGRLRREAEFLAAVQERHGPPTIDARRVVAAVFRVLERHVSAGEIEDVKRVLPRGLLGLWPPEAPPELRPDIFDRAVGQFMTRDLVTASASDALRGALSRMASAGIRHLLVLSPDRADARPIRLASAVGMLSDRDALDVLRREPGEDVRLEWHLVRDVMTHAPLLTIGPTASLSAAAGTMHREGVSALVVVERGEVLGILTSDDLLYAGSLLEEDARA